MNENPVPSSALNAGTLCLLCAGCDAEVGERIAEAYREAGFRVWTDTDFSETVWSGELQNAIAGAGCTVLLYSEKAYYTARFWQCYWYLKRLKKFRMILHLDENRNKIGCDRGLERECRVNLRLENACLSPEINWISGALRRASETETKEPVRDLGLSVADSVTVNLRTRESWDGSRRPAGLVTDEQLSCLRETRPQRYLLLPESFASDYTGSGEASAPAAEPEKPAPGWEKQDGGPFPEGYPYMDEFEYTDSL